MEKIHSNLLCLDSISTSNSTLQMVITPTTESISQQVSENMVNQTEVTRV